MKHKELLVLAVATSIDALAVGVTFSMVELSVSIWLAVCLIGCTTFRYPWAVCMWAMCSAQSTRIRLNSWEALS